jgi:signal-transduction protein with cAMP-binding, CBS, and nucleotidyltransferase domain
MNSTTTARTAMHATLVRDVMHPAIAACSQSAGIAEVAHVMADCRVHCVVVIDDADDDQEEPAICGIVSDLDLLKWAAGPDVHATAGAVARDPIAYVAPDTALHEAAETMVEHETHHLVVLQSPQHTPLGILSALDIAAVLAHGSS